MRVWVLLFNPNTENEGIYTLKVNDRDTVVAFLEEDDAIRYAGLLEAQDFLNPVVEPIDSVELEEFCRDAGHLLKLVEADEMNFFPPEYNVEDMDWSPERKAAEKSSDRANDDEIPDNDDPVISSDPVIEEMRRRLERLL
ncbi:MAG: DUF3110 domain-containing protein [Pseudanabaenaceae cyanobacterium]|jgi:hypothetical protein